MQQPHLWLLSLERHPADALLVSEHEQACSLRLPQAQRQRYLLSRGWLRRQLAMLWQLPALAVPLHSPPGEPPLLADGFGFVSLSHSREQLLLAWSPWPIGVDLEWQARQIQAEGLASRFFPPQEWQRLQSLDPAERMEMVLESWVRKEAAIKWQRSSLATDLRHWCWNAERSQLRHLEHGWQPACICERQNGWLCGVVGQGVDQGIWG